MLAPGENVTIQAAVTPDNATDASIKWSSSNTSIATVSGGKVTAVAEGRATITAEANDGSGVKATCEITVTKATVAVTEVTVSPSSLEMTVGDATNLTAAVKPTDATNTSVSWRSSDPTVVQVDSTGHVTAVKAGTATVTATAEDGSGVSGSCSITVKESAGSSSVPVTGVSLNYNTVSGVVNENISLNADVLPTNATDPSVTWSSSDPSIATVDSTGKVTMRGRGRVTITCTTRDGGHTASCEIDVS